MGSGKATTRCLEFPRLCPPLYREGRGLEMEGFAELPGWQTPPRNRTLHPKPTGRRSSWARNHYPPGPVSLHVAIHLYPLSYPFRNWSRCLPAFSKPFSRELTPRRRLGASQELQLTQTDVVGNLGAYHCDWHLRGLGAVWWDGALNLWGLLQSLQRHCQG